MAGWRGECPTGLAPPSPAAAAPRPPPRRAPPRWRAARSPTPPSRRRRLRRRRLRGRSPPRPGLRAVPRPAPPPPILPARRLRRRSRARRGRLGRGAPPSARARLPQRGADDEADDAVADDERGGQKQRFDSPTSMPTTGTRRASSIVWTTIQKASFCSRRRLSAPSPSGTRRRRPRRRAASGRAESPSTR